MTAGKYRFTEPARRDLDPQIPIRRGDHAHIEASATFDPTVPPML
jgi:hypothetical protein